MNKSEIIQKCIDTVILKTNLTPLDDDSSHEQMITHYATENGSNAALNALWVMLDDAMTSEANEAKDIGVKS